MVDLSICVSGTLKSLTIIALLIISPFKLVSFCLMYWGAYIGYIYIYNCYIFFLDWSFDHYIVAFIFSLHSLYFRLFYLIWVLLILLSFGLHLHGISFFSPSLPLCMCPLVWGGYLVDSIYRVLVLLPFYNTSFVTYLSICPSLFPINSRSFFLLLLWQIADISICLLRYFSKPAIKSWAVFVYSNFLWILTLDTMKYSNLFFPVMLLFNWSRFTTLCECLLCSKVIQLCTYMCIYTQTFFY